MDLHVVWGWLDSVLNGCKRCFCYIIVHLTVQLCCIVKLFCMLFLQKMLKQIGGLVFLTFLGDRRNVSGWVQPNLFKKSDGKEREPIALIVVPHLRNFGSVFFLFTHVKPGRKKRFGARIFFLLFICEIKWKTLSDTEYKYTGETNVFLFHEWNWLPFFSLPGFTHEEKILLWKTITWGKHYPEKKFFTCPQGSCRSLWLALAFLSTS